MFVHLTLVPFIPSAGELKTKPTQHSVKELLNVGIQPQMLLCRCDRPIPENERRKIALFCNVRPQVGDRGARRRYDLRRADQLPRRGHGSRSAAALRPAGGRRARPVALGGHRRCDPRTRGRGAHRRGRQVHQPAGQLQIAGRGADTRRHRQPREGAARLGGQRDLRARRRGAPARGVQRHPGARRLRRARHAGQDRGGALRAREARAVLRHLLRHADGGDRGGAEPCRPALRLIDRVRPVRRTGGRPADRMGARQRGRAPRWKAATSAARCGSAHIRRC